MDRSAEDLDMLLRCIRPLVATLTGVFLLFLTVHAQGGPADNGLRDIMLILDNSGSMKKNDPSFLTKAAVKEFVRRTSASTSAAIIVFDSNARLVVPLTPLSGKQSHTVLAGLDQINYRGLLTNIPAAMERAIYELKLNSRPAALKSIILLTDGIIDTGNPARDGEAGKWLRQELATDAARHEIKVFGIALTDKADFQLLQSLAVTTEGDYFRAEQATEITRIFERIGQLIASPAPSAEPPGLESLAPEAKEIPSFVTVEVMGNESAEADPTESPTASEPAGLTHDSPPTAQAPVSFVSSSHVRLAWAFALAGLGILGVATWRYAGRNRIVKPGSADATALVSAGAVPSAYLHDLNTVTGQKRYALRQAVTVVGRVAPDRVETRTASSSTTPQSAGVTR